ncbi:hypothetical protein HK098_004336 [Nowakowskiella sp. JEL0407]|nr:hypothetical protein HK098_004336 [Nowakowskiella sp. JEL0407]
MFIIVKFGANEEHIFNSNCLASVLLNHIKRHPQVVASLIKSGAIPQTDPRQSTSIDIAIDLASESGEVMDLLNKPKESARKYLDARGTYILVRVVGEESDESLQYVSLLEQAADKKFAVSQSSRQMKGKKGHTGLSPNPMLGSGYLNTQDSENSQSTPRQPIASDLANSNNLGVSKRKGKDRTDRLSNVNMPDKLDLPNLKVQAGSQVEKSEKGRQSVSKPKKTEKK